MRFMEKKYGMTIGIAVLVGFAVMLILTAIVSKHPVYVYGDNGSTTSVVTTATTKRVAKSRTYTKPSTSYDKTRISARASEVVSKRVSEINSRVDESTRKISSLKEEYSKKTSMINRQISEKVESVINKEITTKERVQSMTPAEFRRDGVVYANGYRYTYYSEKVLPGKALNIPGRHSDGNFVRDGDGYICVASCDLPKGTVVDTPFGEGKVYDVCGQSGTIDIYVSF